MPGGVPQSRHTMVTELDGLSTKCIAAAGADTSHKINAAAAARAHPLDSALAMTA